MNIIGRLTRDAVVRTTRDQQQVVNFSVGVDESYRKKDGQWVKRKTFFDCSYWRTANIAPLLTKGTIIELIGYTSAKVWHDKDGVAHASLNFRTDLIKLHGGGTKTSELSTPLAENVLQTMDDDLPF